MSSLKEAERVLKCLGRHSSIVADAYINNKGTIAYTDQNANAITRLLKDRLVWCPNESNEVNISSVLGKLLDKALIRSRRQNIDLDIGQKLNEIEDTIIFYQQAKSLASIEDVDRYSFLIEEQVYELIENIKSAANVFAQHISDEFSYVKNIELRIKENEKTIEKAKKLNDALNILSIDILSEAAGSESFLINLLCQILPKTINRCREELIDSLHTLTKMLFTLNEQHDRNKLISNFLKKYTIDPGYMPDTLEFCATPPPVTNIVRPLNINAYPDIFDSRQILILSKIISSIKIKPKNIAEKPSENNLIEFDSVDEVEEIYEPQLITDFYNLLNRVKLTKSNVSAMNYFYESQREYDSEIWLLSVMNSFMALSETDKKLYTLKYIEEQDIIYDGNYYIEDLNIGLI